MTRNPIAREPVITQLVFGVLTWAITRYGLDVSEAQALEIAGVAVLVLAPFVRQLVTPTAKVAIPPVELSHFGPVAREPDPPPPDQPMD